jgi:hypothetical protein
MNTICNNVIFVFTNMLVFEMYATIRIAFIVRLNHLTVFPYRIRNGVQIMFILEASHI